MNSSPMYAVCYCVVSLLLQEPNGCYSRCQMLFPLTSSRVHLEMDSHHLGLAGNDGKVLHTLGFSKMEIPETKSTSTILIYISK